MSEKIVNERLISVAILRNGQVLDRGLKSHSKLRMALDPDIWDASSTVLGDVDGFLTNTGRFVDREDAKAVAAASGQIPESWKDLDRPLLSTDLGW